ncbi:MAG: hypothetical protein QOI46_1516, partial [Alphaproteobacteria bacterium]|nr:hypothetical protein [Alphaproteobacteria bacterium]
LRNRVAMTELCVEFRRAPYYGRLNRSLRSQTEVGTEIRAALTAVKVDELDAT